MVLTARSNDQRQQIKAAYKKAYGKVSYGTLDGKVAAVGCQ